VEYGDAIGPDISDRAYRLALRFVAEGKSDLRAAAYLAVARTYCSCVTDAEDAAERHFSEIHRNLVDELEARLAGSAIEEQV